MGQSSAEIIAELKARFSALPPQLNEAVRSVIDHPTDVALLTLGEQVRRSGAAPAMPTRLAQHLGLKGYNDLRRRYAETGRKRPESFYDRAQRWGKNGPCRRRDEGQNPVPHGGQCRTSPPSTVETAAS